jgi:hypothetical protein
MRICRRLVCLLFLAEHSILFERYSAAYTPTLRKPRKYETCTISNSTIVALTLSHFVHQPDQGLLTQDLARKAYKPPESGMPVQASQYIVLSEQRFAPNWNIVIAAENS